MTSGASEPAIPCVTGHGEALDELRVDGIRMVLVRYAPGLALCHHTHDLPKLTIVMEGGATERIGEELIEHEPFAVVARARFRVHENQYHARGARALVIELDEARTFAGELSPDAARRHGERLVGAFRAPRGSRAGHVRAAICDLTAAWRDARPRRTPAWLEHARARLFAELAAPPPLVDLARAVGVHPVHLAQAFQRRWSVTPLGYVRAHRVFRAVDLVARGGPLSEVAAEVGFADQSHMTRAIGRARQAPPGALRRAMRDADPNRVQDGGRRRG
jgi:AraC family transcriptional regulator